MGDHDIRDSSTIHQTRLAGMAVMQLEFVGWMFLRWHGQAKCLDSD